MSRLEGFVGTNPWLGKTPESILPSRVFTKEVAEAIGKYRGGKVYTVSGEAIETQRRHNIFPILDHTHDRLVTRVKVPAGQFAVFPGEPFVEGSKGLTYSEQEKLLEEETRRLREKLGVQGFKLIVPTAPIVTEIFLRHYLEQEQDPQPLFGSRRTTSTLTSIGNTGEYFAKVGYFQKHLGLFVFKAKIDEPLPENCLLRVAVPTSA